jgi:hypothetical protein
MPTYQDFKDFYNDFKNDPVMIKIFRALGIMAILIILVAGIGAWWRGCHEKPVSFLWGFYQSNPKDTINKISVVYKDTCTVKNGNLPQRTYKDNAHHIESHGQKGGQTADQITNNK